MLITSAVALLADIHGNVRALEAVFSDLYYHQSMPILLAGDLVMNGPRPAETIHYLRAQHLASVVGNTDMETLKAHDLVGAWTQQQLDDDDLSYLAALPLALRIAPYPHATPEHELLLVHATPRHWDDLLILQPHPLGTTFTVPTPLDDARTMLAGQRAHTIVYGHIHYASQGMIDGQMVRSIGSVGFPYDGDQRAAYTIARWQSTAQTWSFQEHRVDYDYEQVASDLEQSTIPFAPRYARMIREANWFPRPSGVNQADT